MEWPIPKNFYFIFAFSQRLFSSRETKLKQSLRDFTHSRARVKLLQRVPREMSDEKIGRTNIYQINKFHLLLCQNVSELGLIRCKQCQKVSWLGQVLLGLIRCKWKLQWSRVSGTATRTISSTHRVPKRRLRTRSYIGKLFTYLES